MDSEGARLAPLALDDPAEIGAFKLIGRLGAGGMGVVYFGRDPSGLSAAVKTVRAEYAADPGYRARFAREVDLAKRVRGRCIAPLLAAGPDDDRPWLAVAYVPGPTLSTHIAEHGPLRGGDLTAFAAGLAEALAAIHREGIVHRDLKPDNVILAPDGPKVLDFGIAQALDEVSMTRMDVVVGTPGWISPERYDGHRAGPASDMFCWGGLVSFAASGRPPFGTGPVEVLRYRTVNEEPDSAAEHLPAALHDVVRRALARDPDQRPDADTVFAAITGESVDAADTSAAQEHMTRVATRLIDADWRLAVTDSSALFPAEPVRAATARRPITFAGVGVHEPAALAELLLAHPERAERWLRGDGSGRLREWLDDIGDAVYDRDYLRGIASPEQAAVAVTAFVAGYLRDTPPVYRGQRVDVDGLRALAGGGPPQHLLLSEIILNEIPLIAAAHRCGHPGCGPRCRRLERIGMRTRPVVDAVLTETARMGLRPAPAERDRAVALAVVTVDDTERGDTVRDVRRAWAAVAVPWWRDIALRALRADPTTDQGLVDLVLARFTAPYARTAAAPAWRGALSPRRLLSVGGLRVGLMAFLMWCLFAAAWNGLLVAGGVDEPRPPFTDLTPAALAVAYSAVMWPFFLIMAVGLALMPARRRAVGVFAGSAIALVYASAAPFASGLEVMAPDAVLVPLLDAVGGMGEGGAVPLVGAALATPLLFVWLLATLPRDPDPYRVPAPFLHRAAAPFRMAAAVVGIALTVWLPTWGTLITFASLTPESTEPGFPDEVRQVFGSLSGALLPLALVFAVLAYAMWRRIGGHALYLGAIAAFFGYATLVERAMDLGVPGLGGLSAWLVLERPETGAWVGLLTLPATCGLGVWVAERMLHRRRPPRPLAGPGGHPAAAAAAGPYATGPVGHGTGPTGFGTPFPGGTQPGYATPFPGAVGAGYVAPNAQVSGFPPAAPMSARPSGAPMSAPPPGGSMATPVPPPVAPTRVQPDPTRLQQTRVDADPTRLGADPTRVDPEHTRIGTDAPRVDPGQTPPSYPSGPNAATQVGPGQSPPPFPVSPDAATRVAPGQSPPSYPSGPNAATRVGPGQSPSPFPVNPDAATRVGPGQTPPSFPASPDAATQVGPGQMPPSYPSGPNAATQVGPGWGAPGQPSGPNPATRFGPAQQTPPAHPSGPQEATRVQPYPGTAAQQPHTGAHPAAAPPYPDPGAGTPPTGAVPPYPTGPGAGGPRAGGDGTAVPPYPGVRPDTAQPDPAAPPPYRPPSEETPPPYRPANGEPPPPPPYRPADDEPRGPR
jgi:hypothetical protein